MSKFYLTIIIYFLVQLPFMFWVDADDAFAYSMLSLAVLFVLVMSMSLMIRANFFLTARHRLDSDHVMLTFDDGPHPALTPRTLDILEEKGVKAMFFLIGKNIEQYPELVERIVREGHLVGGHSYHHEWSIGFKTGRQLTQELMQPQRQLSEITGQDERYFRPPFGVTNAHIAYAVQQNKLKTIGWSLRTYDTAADFSTEKVARIVKRAKPRDIVLLHERMESTVEALPALIDGIRQKGMEFGVLTAKS
ncbi:polysaccharide deacetylase family protein [Reichenbachiella agariperforans]|nr:polysaccharide deacetylase family protein [Reichenbachiella agariperforans]